MTKDEIFKSLLTLSRDVNKRVLLLTHIDMDAAGAAVLIRLVYPNADVKYCTNATMSREIKYHVTNDIVAGNYDYIFACDISVSEEDAAIIDASVNKKKLVILDHHPSARYLNDYAWAICQPELVEDSYRKGTYYGDVDGHSSGTSLMFDYLEHNGMFDAFEPCRLSFIKSFVHLIAAYDTWDWNEVFNACEAFRTLDRLCEIYGVELFVDTYLNRILSSDYIMFNDTDKLFLSVEKKKIESHLERVQKAFELRTLQSNMDGKYYSVVYAYGGTYMQETFELMKTLYPDFDMYIINYGGGIALRGVKDNIDIGAIAKMFGGGGHPGAGGFKISYEMLDEHMEQILQGKLYKIEE